ncbi:hypothetical protein PHSC3_001058 [Chlamydiales bacterium STE3]|nr:hypothetical protein PHSC3_001058 [Chlamydiales bacterium STE3]
MKNQLGKNRKKRNNTEKVIKNHIRLDSYFTLHKLKKKQELPPPSKLENLYYETAPSNILHLIGEI